MICTQIKRADGTTLKKWLIGWRRVTKLLLRQLSVNFNDRDTLVTTVFIVTFTINPVCEVLHPAGIVLNVGSLYDFQGATGNQKTTNPVTVSSIQLMGYDHGCHYLLKYRHDNVQVDNYNHVGTTQVTGVGSLTHKKEIKLITSTTKPCSQLRWTISSRLTQYIYHLQWFNSQYLHSLTSTLLLLLKQHYHIPSVLTVNRPSQTAIIICLHHFLLPRPQT